MIDQSLAHRAHESTSYVDKGQALFEEEFDSFQYLGRGRWLLPSATTPGRHYKVSTRGEGSCECLGWWHSSALLPPGSRRPGPPEVALPVLRPSPDSGTSPRNHRRKRPGLDARLFPGREGLSAVRWRPRASLNAWEALSRGWLALPPWPCTKITSDHKRWWSVQNRATASRARS